MEPIKYLSDTNDRASAFGISEARVDEMDEQVKAAFVEAIVESKAAKEAGQKVCDEDLILSRVVKIPKTTEEAFFIGGAVFAHMEKVNSHPLAALFAAMAGE